MCVSTALAGWYQHSWGPPAKGGPSLISYLQCLVRGGALKFRDICQDLERLLQCKQNFPVGCGVLAPTNTSGISCKLCCADPWCVCWLYAHVFFIYIYIICLFLKGRQKSKSCSSSVIPQNPLAQLQFSGECRCFLARVWPVADRSSEALKMQLLAYFLCTRTPSSAARFPSEGTCSW